MKIKMVWVEIGEDHYPIHIFKNLKAAQTSGRPAVPTTYALAVSRIRHKVWVRCNGECEQCCSVVREDFGHMHEKVWRGKGGEVSLANSIFICPQCHHYDHRSRNPRWGKEIKA